MIPRHLLPAAALVLTLVAVPVLLHSISQPKTTKGSSRFLFSEQDRTPNPACVALSAKLTAFPAESAKLAPGEAAEKWLSLHDELSALSSYDLMRHNHASQIGGPRLDFAHLLQSLPSTASWDAIQAGLESRAASAKPAKAASLRLLAALLKDDPAELKNRLAQISKLPASAFSGNDYGHGSTLSSARELLASLAEREGRSEDVVAALEASIAEAREGDDVVVPDLLRLMPEEKAAPLVLKALLSPSGCEVVGEKTRRLAARLALENVAKLRKPAWNLVERVGDIPLYEALAAKFGNSEGGGYSGKDNADEIYLLLLIAEGRTRDALAFTQGRHRGEGAEAISLSPGTIEAFRRQGLGRQVFDFLKVLLASNPELPYWSPFITLSAHVKASDEALAFLQETLAKAKLSGPSALTVRNHLAQAFLAADQPDQAIVLLRQNVGSPIPREGNTQLLAKRAERIFEDALTLARLGNLLQRPELVSEGLSTARRLVVEEQKREADFHAKAGSGRSGSFTSEIRYDSGNLISLYLTLGQLAEAESLVLGQLAHKRSMNQKEDFSPFGSSGSDHLGWLVQIHSRQGRHAEVVRLLDEAPEWGATDLADMGRYSSALETLHVTAAKAFAETGRKPLASKILRHHILRSPGDDEAYSLLLSLGEPDVAAFLDRVSARHRFQERPLIWKARLLLDAGNPVEAEKIIREAIAVDPSDGEQGKGDRMRAYAILAEILQLKGDSQTAAIMEGAVKAIRLSEEADDWWEAGLLTRAVALYEKSLTLFADAYCIQSRLALRYSEMGDLAKAEKHYRRAFELMPDSFGRVESHCFGCEGAFSGEVAQNVAEKVFTELAAKSPAKPQVFYLLGYLRSQQSRYPEAAEAFRKAVALDPDYLNAWKKLGELDDNIAFAPAELDNIRLQLFRLDPEGYAGRKVAQLSSLRKLWDIVLTVERQRPPLAREPLYPLAASARQSKAEAGGFHSSFRYGSSGDKPPRSLLGENKTVQSAVRIIEQLSSH